MNEKTPKQKAEALRRARTVQQNESPEIKAAQKDLEENVQVEDFLYARRGYGGYIKTEEIQAIRETTEEIVARIEELRTTP